MGSEVYWRAVKWSEVKWREVKWSENKWGEVKWREVKWKEVRWSKVKWSEEKWSEVMISGEMCVLSFTYSYVAVLCSVQYVVSLLFALLCYFLITRIMF